MTRSLHHGWLRRIFAVLALGALLLTTGAQITSAAPVKQDISKGEIKEMCELAGGEFVEDDRGNRFACFFDSWAMICDGVACEISCDRGTPCIDTRTVSRSLRQASLADDQKVVTPVATPTPTPAPHPRNRGRSTTNDGPLVVGPLATPVQTSTNTPSPPKNDVTDPVLIDQS